MGARQVASDVVAWMSNGGCSVALSRTTKRLSWPASCGSLSGPGEGWPGQTEATLPVCTARAWYLVGELIRFSHHFTFSHRFTRILPSFHMGFACMCARGPRQ